MTRSELHFENIRRAIQQAPTAKEVVAEYCRDYPQRIRAEFIRQLTKRAHHLYKGNLQKTRDHFLRKVNIDEHNYAEVMDERINNN